jgi:sialate O-acetylesterase
MAGRGSTQWWAASRLVGLMLAACLQEPAFAEVRLAAVFSDHAVLQRDVPLPIWGWAEPGEAVAVTLGSATAQAKAGEDGRWQATLPAQFASRTPLTLVAEGRNRVEIQDLLLGDVWLCGGQSNMEWSLGACNAPDDVRGADDPLIRQFGVELHFATTPQRDVRGRWTVCTPRTAAGFTAVGYHFARRVRQAVDVPIGLVRSCVGGTNIELWMAQDSLLQAPGLEAYAKMMRESLARHQQELAAAVPTLEAWTAAARRAMAAGAPLPMPPPVPEFPFGEKVARPRCVTLHNGMIAPLVPLRLKGAIWYQGENNAGGAEDGRQYVEKTRLMLADWRRWFGNDRLPFYFVQLAAWQKPSDRPEGGDGWAFIRDAQRHCLAIPHTGMAVAIDIGDTEDIHPRNKADVGARLARWALANEYGVRLEPSGPLFRGLRIEGDRAIVTFDHVGGGLMVGAKDGRQPVRETPDAALRRFAVAGVDRRWQWAAARIVGDTVECRHPDVPEPVAVRYAFTMNPADANLYNRDGLPAAPFRSDDW